MNHQMVFGVKCTQPVSTAAVFLGTKSQHDTNTHAHACTHTLTHKMAQQPLRREKKGNFHCVTENEQQIVTL